MKALIFDFDGTILDTEQAEYTAWTRTYARYGGELTLQDYLPWVGTFDPYGPDRPLRPRAPGGVSPADRLLPSLPN